jgi:hypothetical protein
LNPFSSLGEYNFFRSFFLVLYKHENVPLS